MIDDWQDELVPVRGGRLAVIDRGPDADPARRYCALRLPEGGGYPTIAEAQAAADRAEEADG